MASNRRQVLAGAGVLLGGALGFGLLKGLQWQTPSLLRPPGALDESRFLATCIRCGQCVEACPYNTLRLAEAPSGAAMGTPFLVPRMVPCYLCQAYDELMCIAACPTGALQPVSEQRDVSIGTAVIDKALCLAWQGMVCRACWHACPFPNEAIYLDERGKPVIVAEECVGCGLCDHACLTEPSSITIVPTRV